MNGDMVDNEFRELADNAPVMIWRARTDKLCDWFNQPWRDFSGKNLDQLFGYGWADDVHPDDLNRCVGIYETAFDARQTFSMPYRLKRHDGIYRWFLDNGAAFYREGEFAGYFGSCIDITEQRELQEHQQVLLAELNHRVKNNLQLIISFLQLSKIRADGQEAKDLLQAAIGRIKGVGAIQDELHKNVSGMIDLGEYLPSLARTALTVESNGSATLLAETQSVRVPFQTASNLGLIVNELVTNSIKHAGAAAQGTVILRVAKIDAGAVEISVADRGPGFSADTPTDSSPAVARGHGLIDALTRRCGGTLVRENRGGAVVRITIPMNELEAGATEC